MRHTFLFAFAAACACWTPLAFGAERVTASAHGEALYLVLTDQAELLRRLDPDAETLETAVRTWSVFRPADSGVLDRPNTFTVTLSVDGHAVASWYVNTGEGTVEPNDVVVAAPLP